MNLNEIGYSKLKPQKKKVDCKEQQSIQSQRNKVIVPTPKNIAN
jgi:hypothetical protein